MPALRALAAAFPERRRVLAAPRALAPLLALAATGFELADVPAWVGGATHPDPALAARLPQGALAVNLHGRGPESHALLRATRPERLIGFDTSDGPAWDPREHEVARWCRLLNAHGIPADPSDLDLRPPTEVAPAGYTLVHPGAASAARRWPAERWAAVARGERARGRRVLLSGSAREAAPAARIAARAGLPPDANRAGATDGDLAALAALVAGAGRVACGDTGVAHLATALRVPSVVLFGPTDPRRWGPPPDRPWHTVLWPGTTGDPHAAAPDPGLLRIRPADVLDALSALPAPSPRPRRPAR